MTIRTMSLEDLQMVLGWAAEEGWNPGLDDAAAFHAADPKGFLIKRVDERPVAAISVVNHDPDVAFLGLYLCKPEFRGQGHGIDIWRAGIAHAGTRSIGLDGVPDQQANYGRSGFKKYGSTIRYEGRGIVGADPSVRPANASDVPALSARDKSATGMDRVAFMAKWVVQTSTRQTMVLADGDLINGFATFRRCGTGVKIGPLHAESEDDARALLASCPFVAGAETSFVDVQDHSVALIALLTRQGFQPVFETARMFRGNPPETTPFAFEAIGTMELG